MSSQAIPTVNRLTNASLLRALRRGWQMFVLTRTLSVSYAMVFAVLGLALLVIVERASYTPMIVPLAGGFMLLGPILISGYFAIAERIERNEPFAMKDIVHAFTRSSAELLLLGFACALLFVVWIMDTSLLYGFLLGRTPEPLASLLSPSPNTLTFLLSSALLGFVLAALIFAVSVFSVPLLFHHRTNLVDAVHLSLSAVYANPVHSLAWALIVAVATIGSILIFPLFLLTFPVLAFASHEIYHEMFPEQFTADGLAYQEDEHD